MRYSIFLYCLIMRSASNPNCRFSTKDLKIKIFWGVLDLTVGGHQGLSMPTREPAVALYEKLQTTKIMNKKFDIMWPLTQSVAQSLCRHWTQRTDSAFSVLTHVSTSWTFFPSMLWKNQASVYFHFHHAFQRSWYYFPILSWSSPLIISHSHSPLFISSTNSLFVSTPQGSESVFSSEFLLEDIVRGFT